jgi:glycosyltransferase involved in cell wall biosynthesis
MCPRSALTISIVVPVHNGGEDFKKCLRGLLNCVPQPEEIIVVADGDTDGSWQIAEEFGATVIRNETPKGPGLARNLGASRATGNVVFFVDADVVIAPDALAQISSTFEQDPEIAAVFGSYDDAPAAANFLSQYKNLLHHYTHQMAREEASTFWSGCGAVRREVFLALGGFDCTYKRPSIEDIELGYRLKQAGYRVRLCKALQGKHLKHWNTVSLINTDFFQRALPWTELILSRSQPVNDLNLGWSSRASVVSVYLLVAATLIALWRPSALLFAAIFAIALLCLNAHLYTYLSNKRGVRFTVQAIPWHWFYYLYSGLAFGIGMAQHLLLRQAKSPQSVPTAD